MDDYSIEEGSKKAADQEEEPVPLQGASEWAQGVVALPGRNPHYQPPIMRWNTIEIQGLPGMAFKVVLDSPTTGSLCLRVYGPNEDFQLKEGEKVDYTTEERPYFVIHNPERGPAVGHERENDPETGRCRICGADY